MLSMLPIAGFKLQVTAVFTVPVRVAVNGCTWFSIKYTGVGETEMVI